VRWTTVVDQYGDLRQDDGVESADLDLPTLVSLAGPAVVSLLLQRIAHAGHQGVKPSHGYVIQRLVEEEPTVGALAESLRMTQQGASKQVNDLESLGYVERIVDETDHRIRYVRLTAAGREVLEAGRAARVDLERELVARVGQDTVDAARSAMVGLLQLTGLERHISSRSVPLPRD
jgi:DNA-binding MarR family transcriptional regulator